MIAHVLAHVLARVLEHVLVLVLAQELVHVQDQQIVVIIVVIIVTTTALIVMAHRNIVTTGVAHRVKIDDVIDIVQMINEIDHRKKEKREVYLFCSTRK